jgi:hypothetical protein
MPETGQATEAKTSSGWLITFLVSLPLLYVLSIGPVAAVASRTQGFQHRDWLVRFYAPVIWLHQHTILEGPLEAYVNLWVGD